MPKNSNVLFLVAALLLCSACGKSKVEEVKSGRLKYAETVRYGSVGTHGSEGWYVSDRRFYVNGSGWSPKDLDVNEHIAGCEPSPDEAVEAIKCYSFADSKETVYLLRVKGNAPEWLKASDAPYEGGDNLGEWVGEGRWLLFKDYYFNVETSERREIKGLPDYPQNFFLAASPDLETIMYRESCFGHRLDPETGKPLPDEETERQCRTFEEHFTNGIAAFWLIEARTGGVKVIELKKSDYPWAANTDSFLRTDWLKEFRRTGVAERRERKIQTRLSGLRS
jgi:hypothetical protein